MANMFPVMIVQAMLLEALPISAPLSFQCRIVISHSNHNFSALYLLTHLIRYFAGYLNYLRSIMFVV